jgi:hypothetical protein
MTTADRTCRRCRSAIEAGDLRCPVCYQAVPHLAEGHGAVSVQMLRCRSCGAAMEYRVRVRAPQCAFCAGVLKLEEQIDPVEQAEKHLEFTIDRKEAVEVYRRSISRQGFF